MKMKRKQTGTTLSDMFPSKWLSADDVDEGMEVTITGLSEELVGRDKELKYALHFRELPKLLILNVTNGRAIRDITGEEDSDLWTGAVVRLTTPVVQFGDKSMPAIRIGFPLAKKSPIESRRSPARTPVGELEEPADSPY